MKDAGLDGDMSKLPVGSGGLGGPLCRNGQLYHEGGRQPMVSLWRALSGGSLAMQDII